MKKRKQPPGIELIRVLQSRIVMTLREIQEALGRISIATARRRLAGIDYRSSYNFNGRYYCLHDPARYDRYGLWSYEGIRFSREGNLTETVRRLVQESESGYTQQELRHLLGVRVQNVLVALMKRTEVVRESVGPAYLYVHSAEGACRRQVDERRQRIAEMAASGEEVPLESVISILLVLIRHPESDPVAVARRLRGRSPPVGIRQVRSVFRRYQLGQKKGL